MLFPVSIYLFKVNNKWCEVSPKSTKNPHRKGCLKDLPDSDIHSSSCEEGDFSGSFADSDAAL